MAPRVRPALALVAGLLLLAACGATPSASVPTEVPPSAPAESLTPSAEPTDGMGEVIPAPGSGSEVYEPNPAAIVVAIDPGHGGCLDWGVPNRFDNTVEKAEKADTLAIGLHLRDLLEEQGVTVVMTRTDDSALAGDDYAELGCTGPAWRDVDGDGEAGFEETGRIRTRDELQARIDLANLARADLLVSIHVNSLTEDGVVFEIAATQTFYDDETPWGEPGSGRLGRLLQARVVAALDDLARYEREDRGTQAVAYYLVARQWQDGDTCERPADTWCKPHRGADVPAVLAEVGSMSHEAESELLASAAGREVVAAALFAGIRDWIAGRPLAVRYDALLPGGEAGGLPVPAQGEGAPYWAPAVGPEDLVDGRLPVRLTNTGTAAWPAGLELWLGSAPTGAPYLAEAPDGLAPADLGVPSLAPGESVTVHVPMMLPSGGRHVTWLTLVDRTGTPLTDVGSAPLQLASGGG
jgi:N-acetylmuramoyl-L-alanine amidase